MCSNHVVLHQSVIGLEAVEQLYSVEPGGADIVFGCAGGGRTWAGCRSRSSARRSTAAPTRASSRPSQPPARRSRRGEYRYDHGDVAGLTPLLKMHTLGMDFVPDPIHAGGLRYHGMAPALSHTVEQGLVSGVAITQHDAFAAGVQFARAQGIVPAPESTHAIAACAARGRRQRRRAGRRHRAVGSWPTRPPRLRRNSSTASSEDYADSTTPTLVTHSGR